MYNCLFPTQDFKNSSRTVIPLIVTSASKKQNQTKTWHLDSLWELRHILLSYLFLSNTWVSSRLQWNKWWARDILRLSDRSPMG